MKARKTKRGRCAFVVTEHRFRGGLVDDPVGWRFPVSQRGYNAAVTMARRVVRRGSYNGVVQMFCGGKGERSYDNIRILSCAKSGCLPARTGWGHRLVPGERRVLAGLRRR